MFFSLYLFYSLPNFLPVIIIQFVAFYQIYQFRRVFRVCSITGLLKTLCPSLVICTLQFEQGIIPFIISQKIGMFHIGIIARLENPIATAFAVMFLSLPLLASALNAEMIVGFLCQCAAAVSRFEYALCQFDTCRNSRSFTLRYSNKFVSFYIGHCIRRTLNSIFCC